MLHDSKVKRLHVMVALGALGVLVGSNGCNTAVDKNGTPVACEGLHATARAQATILAYGQACAKLQSKAAEVEAKWLGICNGVNGELGLDTSKTTAKDACAILNARVKQALNAGVTVKLDVQASCSADVKAQVDCEGKCQGSANCAGAAKCAPGKLVVECNGACDATCDVQAPSFACNGTCQGTCTASAAVQCSGQ